MRFIQISPVRHLRADAFDEVNLRGVRIVFSQTRGPFVNVDFGETGQGPKTDAGIHAERQYGRLMDWLASGVTGLFLFEPAPKGPDAGCVAVDAAFV